MCFSVRVVFRNRMHLGFRCSLRKMLSSCDNFHSPHTQQAIDSDM
jgi:hypothetical protein